MTILLVDDDKNCIALWTRMLASLKADILFANSIDDALPKMDNIPPPDVVLLDLKLPPFNAGQSLLAIHAFRAKNPNLAVIAVSGMRLEEILQAIEDAGVTVQGAMSKDDTMSQNRLLASVKAALVSGRGFRDTMAVLETTSDAIEKKRTDRIDLPPVKE